VRNAAEIGLNYGTEVVDYQAVNADLEGRVPLHLLCKKGKRKRNKELENTLTRRTEEKRRAESV